MDFPSKYGFGTNSNPEIVFSLKNTKQCVLCMLTSIDWVREITCKEPDSKFMGAALKQYFELSKAYLLNISIYFEKINSS
jgi:hypothetical protein